MKNRRAFTLVELIIAMVITGLVMSAVMTLFFSVFKNYEFHQDISSAKQRGHIALAIIQPFVLNAGLGLPPDDPDAPLSFQSAFVNLPPLAPLFPAQEEQRFTSFVQLADRQPSGVVTTTSATEASALGLVYSVSSGVGVDKGFEARKGFSDTIPITGSIDPQHIVENEKDRLKSWIVFPSSETPFFIEEIGSGATLKLQTRRDDRILPLDELHFVRAAKIYVHDNSLIVDHLDDSGAHVMADGVVGMWCRFDRDDRILTVHILARADTKREPGVQPVLEGWPAAAEAFWPRDNAYRHAVVSRSWRIRN